MHKNSNRARVSNIFLTAIPENYEEFRIHSSYICGQSCKCLVR